LADENTTGYGAVMMKELWQNFVTRNKRAIAEVQQVELEMAKANLIRTGPTIFLTAIICICIFLNARREYKTYQHLRRRRTPLIITHLLR
jgi:hypothetical protein